MALDYLTWLRVNNASGRRNPRADYQKYLIDAQIAAAKTARAAQIATAKAQIVGMVAGKTADQLRPIYFGIDNLIASKLPNSTYLERVDIQNAFFAELRRVNPAFAEWTGQYAASTMGFLDKHGGTIAMLAAGGLVATFAAPAIFAQGGVAVPSVTGGAGSTGALGAPTLGNLSLTEAAISGAPASFSTGIGSGVSLTGATIAPTTFAGSVTAAQAASGYSLVSGYSAAQAASTVASIANSMPTSNPLDYLKSGTPQSSGSLTDAAIAQGTGAAPIPTSAAGSLTDSLIAQGTSIGVDAATAAATSSIMQAIGGIGAKKGAPYAPPVVGAPLVDQQVPAPQSSALPLLLGALGVVGYFVLS